jgi:hypothetical protein
MSANGTTALDALNFGTSTSGGAGIAETTSTLGVDRTDARVPPDQNHVWGQQISACKNLLLQMTQYSLGGTRLKVLAQNANPFGANEAGFWTDGTLAKFTNTSGVILVLGTVNVYNTAGLPSSAAFPVNTLIVNSDTNQLLLNYTTAGWTSVS